MTNHDHQHPSITCPKCFRTSYSRGDIANKYCGNCKKFHSELDLPPASTAIWAAGRGNGKSGMMRKTLNFQAEHCPACASKKITRSWEPQQIPYGSGKIKVTLKCSVPVSTCGDCGIQFTGPDADKIRHDLVMQHARRLREQMKSELANGQSKES